MGADGKASLPRRHGRRASLVLNGGERSFTVSLPETDRAHACPDAVKQGPHSSPIRPLSAVAISVWFGLCAGLFELGLTLAQKPFFDSSPGFFRMNRHIVWSIPTVNLALFGCCGLVLALALRLKPSLSPRSVVAAPVSLGVLTLFLSLQWLHIVACLTLGSVVAFRLTGRIARNLGVFRRIVRFSMPALATVAAGLIGFSLRAHLLDDRREQTEPAASRVVERGAPNVVLVVLDTVRVDHLSVGGYARNTSPNLARFARSGIVFE